MKLKGERRSSGGDRGNEKSSGERYHDRDLIGKKKMLRRTKKLGVKWWVVKKVKNNNFYN